MKTPARSSKQTADSRLPEAAGIHAPVAVPVQIAVLLALTAKLFDGGR